MLIFPEVVASFAVATGWGILGLILRGGFPWCLLRVAVCQGRSVQGSKLGDVVADARSSCHISFSCEAAICCSIVVSISACHAEDPGSIPGGGAGLGTPELWVSHAVMVVTAKLLARSAQQRA